MELAFIREFVTLAEIRKFSAAAQQLHISQSTLSRHIQTLETELGCTLFTRTTRDVELSACGALYLDRKSTRLYSSHNRESRMPSSA